MVKIKGQLKQAGTGPSPRLKNTKKTSKCQVFFYSTRKSKILSQNIEKMQGDPLGKKVSQCRKKMKGGSLWSLPVWYVTRKNRKNLFGSVR